MILAPLQIQHLQVKALHLRIEHLHYPISFNINHRKTIHNTLYLTPNITKTMATIQILSDLHLEAPKAYDIFTITPSSPYLALLGDIGYAATHWDEMQSFLLQQLHAFRAVFFIPGNHEAYNSTWPKTLSVLRGFQTDIALRQGFEVGLGVFVLMDRASFRIPSSDTANQGQGQGDVLVLGCSLFSHVDPSQTAAVEMGLNDFYLTGEGWNVPAHNAAHQRDVAWLNEQVTQADQDSSVKHVVILSHWSRVSMRGHLSRCIRGAIFRVLFQQI